LTLALVAMYTYIMDRTQIYLSRVQAAALDREARRTGLTRSHLIRAAIDQAYLPNSASDEVLEALEASAGAWTDRTESGEAYVERIRSGQRLAELWGDRWAEHDAEEDDEDDEEPDAAGH
jgi:ParB-like chromosome segregation protein Spo0J